MSAMRNAWRWWKRLRLPWRKRFFVGEDLQGNEYWEFKDALTQGRLRRTMKFDRDVHPSTVQVSPQWHQWLRRTRPDAPTLQEQLADVTRQTQLKRNALLADERWAAKAKYIQSPSPPQTNESHQQADIQSWSRRLAEDDPARKVPETSINPGSDYQPEAWNPGAAKR